MGGAKDMAVARKFGQTTKNGADGLRGGVLAVRRYVALAAVLDTEGNVVTGIPALITEGTETHPLREA